MNQSNEDRSYQLESKIENMLDKLIESDEEIDNGDHSSLKFSDDISSSDIDKEEEDLLIKDSVFNQFSKFEDQNQLQSSKNFTKSSFDSFSSKNKVNLRTSLPSNVNCLNNNYSLFSFYHMYPHLNNSFFGIQNNINLYNQKSYEALNSTASNSLINLNFQSYNNSFADESKKYFFNRKKKYHNSYYAGDKICFNNKLKNNEHLFTNVEIELLLIEINRILNKIGKIDQIFYNKLKGKFEQIIRTHKGSRIFQNYLKNTHSDILHLIFLELKNNLSELLKDNYANYFIKKFFECLCQKDRVDFLNTIQNNLNTLAIDMTATYPIQGIIEQLGSKIEKKIIYLGIKNSINIYCYNIYGTHVLEKILTSFEEEFTKEIIDFVYNNFIDLSYNINGICLVKKLLLMTHKKELHQKLKKIVYDNALNLIIHQYGNYVIQVIVENWDDNELENILNIYKNKYTYLSKQKYSSNAVERIIEKNKNNLDYYINEICENNNLFEVMQNNYGNYVIQKAIKLSSGISQEKLLKDIINNIYKLEDRKVINKWKLIISSKTSNSINEYKINNIY